MNQRTFHQLVGVIFGVIALLHLLRVVQGWSAQIGGWSLPMWISWVALIIAGYLSYQAFRFNK